MVEHKGITQVRASEEGIPGKNGLLIPSPRITLDTHLARGTNLPRETWRTLMPRITRSSTVTLGASRTL